MTGILASVRNRSEACSALAASVDIIDLKDPTSGALGALTAKNVAEVVDLVAGRTTVSATIGDLPLTAGAVSRAVPAMALAGVDYVKVGVFGDYRQADVLAALERLCQGGATIVLVFFAERLQTMVDFCRLRDIGVKGVMLDTMDKSSGGLLRKLSLDRLRVFCTGAHDAGLLTGLAGSLRTADIRPLLHLRPDYLGFRTALCRHGQRGAVLELARVQAIRKIIVMQRREQQALRGGRGFEEVDHGAMAKEIQ